MGSYTPNLTIEELLGGEGKNQNRTFSPSLSQKDLLVGSGATTPEQYDREAQAAYNSEHDSFLGAALSGLKSGTGRSVSGVERVIANTGPVGATYWDDASQSSKVRTMDKFLEEGRAPGASLGQSLPVSLIDWGDKFAEEHGRDYTPYSANWFAHQGGALIPNAIALGAGTYAAMRSGKADTLRTMSQATASRYGLGPTGAAVVGEVAPATAIGTATAYPESAMEAEDARQEAIRTGKTEKEADAIYREVLGGNIFWNSGLNTLEVLTGFGRFPVKVSPRTAATVRFGGASAQEGLQEWGQTGISEHALTGKFDPTSDEAIQSAVLGGLGGAMFGGAGFANDMIHPQRQNINLNHANPGEHFDIGEGVNWDGIAAPERTATQQLIWEYNQAFPEDRLTITEGLRDPNATYGSETSWHKQGKGIDLWSEGILSDANKRDWLVQRARELGFGEVLDEVRTPSARSTGPHFHLANFTGESVAGGGRKGSTQLSRSEMLEIPNVPDPFAEGIGEIKTIAKPDDVRERIGRVVDGDKSINYKMPLRKVTESEAALVRELVGVDISGYTHKIDMNSIRHSMKKHREGRENASDQVGMTKADYQYIPDVINSPDRIIAGNDSKSKQKTLRYEKNIGGQIIVVEEILPRNKTLITKTAWKKSLSQTLADENINRGHTSETVDNATSPIPFNLNIDQKSNSGKSYMAAPMAGGIFDGMHYGDGRADGQTISRREVMDKIKELFDIPIRHGRVGKARVRGWFNPESGIIRVGEKFDFDTIAHELGHYMDDRLGGLSADPKHAKELSAWVKKQFGMAYSADKHSSEGVAEFMRQYMTHPEAAQINFPGFYKEFNARLKANPKVADKIGEVRQMFDVWRSQSPEARAIGSISYGDKSGVMKALQNPKETWEAIKDRGRKTYDQWVEEFAPMDRLVKSIEQSVGMKLPEHLQLYEKARLFRGWAGKAETLLSKGSDKSPALRDVVNLIGKRRKEFGSYLVALREMNARALERENLNIRTQMTRAIESGALAADKVKLPDAINYTYVLAEQDTNSLLNKYARDPQFQQARKMLRDYNNELLDRLVDGGLKTQEDVNYLKTKWPDYVPFYRDFSDEGATSAFISARGVANVTDPVKVFQGSKRDIIDPIESIIKNTFDFTNRIEANKVAQTLIDLSKIPGQGHLVEEVVGNTNAGEGVLSVWLNGEKKMFQVQPDVHAAMTGLSNPKLDPIIRALSIPEQVLRMSSTVMEPAFALTNTVRDTFEAFLKARHGFLPVVDNIAGLKSFWRKDALYWEWMDSGGANSHLVALDRNNIQKAINHMGDRSWLERANFEQVREVMSYVSEASEVATRIGIYKRARDKGASIQEAALESRDVTVDFGRAGSMGKKVNKIAAFFNAGIQDIDKFVRFAKEHPYKLAGRTATGIAGLSAMLFFAQHDDERWRELSRRDRDRFWFIIPGALTGDKITKEKWDQMIRSGMTADQILEQSGTIWKIPKPFTVGVIFGSGTERCLEWMMDDNPKAFKGFADSVWDVTAPNMLPNLVKQYAEWSSNYNFFQDRAIVPRSLANLPDKLQYDSRTSEVGKFIGDKLDVSPMKVDNAIRGGGGMFGWGLRASDAVLGADNKRPEMRWNENYGISRFTQTPFAYNDSVTIFYDDYRKQSELIEELKLTGERPEDLDRPYFNRLNAQKKIMDGLTKRERGVLNSPTLTAEQKRKEIDKIGLEKLKVAQRAIKK